MELTERGYKTRISPAFLNVKTNTAGAAERRRQVT